MVSFLKKCNKKILKYLCIAFFILTLVLYPSLIGNELTLVNRYSGEPTVLQQQIKLSQVAVAAPEGTQKEPKQTPEIDFLEMGVGALAGLVLFIYGVTRLSEGLEEIGSERMKNLLSKFTTNRFAGVMTGIVATTALESSSVTIIMVIAMVSAGILTFVQSLGVVLGSNIGTAVGAQIISLNIELYVPIIMFAGMLLMFAGRNRLQRTLGLILLGFGLLFYGLEAIDEAMKPFRNYPPFLNWMKTLGENTFLGAVVGAIFTVIVQSSSATVAIVITLAGSGLISLPAGVAIMLGAEIGTCADTLVATIGRGRPALRTGIFHLLFNLVSVFIGVLFAPLLVQFVQGISGDDVGRQVANAQIIFNITGVAIVVMFLPAIARLLVKLIPDAKSDRTLTTPEPEVVSSNQK
jgi:phosphate:Na+ symporter